MSTWPAIAHEQLTWNPLSRASHGPAATRERKYQAALPALIAKQEAALSAEVFAEVEAAGFALALNAALSLADEISAPAILSVHAVLMESQPRHIPGEWRLEPVWIGKNGDSPVGATYVGPTIHASRTSSRIC